MPTKQYKIFKGYPKSRRKCAVEFSFEPGRKYYTDTYDLIEAASWAEAFIKQADNRYLLPRFGDSAYPTGPVRWPIEEYVAWRRRDPFQRQAEYRALISKKRKEASNIA